MTLPTVWRGPLSRFHAGITWAGAGRSMWCDSRLHGRVDQLHLDIRRDRRISGTFGEFHADDRLAGMCFSGDPNRAVIEHPSAALLQQTGHPVLLVHPVPVDECCLHRLRLGQEVLLEGPEGVSPR